MEGLLFIKTPQCFSEHYGAGGSMFNVSLG